MCAAGAETPCALAEGGSLGRLCNVRFGHVPSGPPRFSRRHEQLCHLRRLRAEGSGKAAPSHFVHASIPAGSKAWKGARPAPVEAWRPLPASSASLGRDASLAAGKRRAGASAGRAAGLGAPSSGAGPGWRTRGSRRAGSFPKATSAEPRGGPVAEVSEHGGLGSSRLCLEGCLGLSGWVCWTTFPSAFGSLGDRGFLQTALAFPLAFTFCEGC